MEILVLVLERARISPLSRSHILHHVARSVLTDNVAADLEGLENIDHYKHTRQASLPCCRRRRSPLLFFPLPQRLQQVRIEDGGRGGTQD